MSFGNATSIERSLTRCSMAVKGALIVEQGSDPGGDGKGIKSGESEHGRKSDIHRAERQ